MQSIEVIIHLKNKSQYTEIFSSDFEVDQYHEDNKEIIERIERKNSED